MKYLFILFIGLFTAAAAKAEIVTREITLKADFCSLEISHDIDVVLTESNEKNIRISGEEKFVNAVLLDEKNGKVRIMSRKGSLSKRKVTVFIPVQNLRILLVKGTSYVCSNGILASNHLQVILDDASKIEINNIGNVMFKAGEGIDLLIRKWNKTNIAR